MDEILREFLARIGSHLDPMVAAFLARLLQFFEEKARAMTALYEEQTRRVGAEVRRVIHQESERLVIDGCKAIGRGLWQLALANLLIAIVVGILFVIGLGFYIRYRWRKFFWERDMLVETREQNRLLRELLKHGLRLDDESKPG